MIDLHTHSLLSDGVLLPSELARRYEEKGFKALAITDHADSSNVDDIVPRIVTVCKKLNSVLKIKLIPGVELTHVPPKHFPELVRYARSAGAKLILIHGETIVEPVIPGTNKKALECDIDILAHPGLISKELALLASHKGIYLELTSRRGHCLTNGHVARKAQEVGAKLILNSDAHSPEDIISIQQAKEVLLGAGLSESEAKEVLKNSEALVKICLTG
jgi:histidinol phosphatase-like PHP family hydrolase